MLLRWNRTVNLIAPADEVALWDRHIADSLQLLPWLLGQQDFSPPLVGGGRGSGEAGSYCIIEEEPLPLPLSTREVERPNSLLPPTAPTSRPSRAIDLGSGAGFPGLIVAIASGIPFDLIEADQRKAAFLREAVRLTGAPANVHAVRIEAATIPPAPLITARALAPLPKLLSLAAPLLAPNGTCLFLKGANAEAELTDAAAQWHMRADRIPSRTAPGARILRITDLSRVAHPA